MINKFKYQIGVMFLLFFCLSISAFGEGKTTPSSQKDKASQNLVNATNQYKASVAALIPIYENQLKEATASLEKRKELYQQGIIAKRDLDQGEQAIKEAQARLDQARKQIVESDQLMAEVKAEKELARLKPLPRATGKLGSYTATSAIMRYSGAGSWSLAQASKVQSFFSSNFGHALPISAFGQTSTHDRMRFDHRNSMDVAVHPDSSEGRALIAYLRSEGIPFLAFRSAVPGAATGAHIHIGYPSHKI